MAYTFDPPYEARAVQIDLFPARVEQLAPQEELIGADLRIIVTDSHFYVFRDGTEAPDNFILKDLVSFEGKTSAGYRVETTDGSVYHVIRNAGCGCGTRLRSFHVFLGVPYARSN